MAFGTDESSREGGTPVEIYRVIYGRDSSAQLRFTDSPVQLTVDGEDYTPAAVTRTSATLDGAAGRSDVTITLPISHPLIIVMANLPPSSTVGLVVRAGHMPDDPMDDLDVDEWPPIWAGVVTEMMREGSEAELNCKTPLSDLEAVGLRRFYQWQCPHVLYGTRCSASKAAATTDTTVATVNGATITLADSLVSGDLTEDDYVGGFIEWESSVGTSYASIMSFISGSMKLSGILDGLDVGSAVSVSLGCARNLDACGRVHDNIINFGGQPWIPSENPLDVVSFG